MPAETRILAWRPPVTGIGEVFHARFVEHAYPMHTHEMWTLLIVDEGLIGYQLARQEHHAVRSGVCLLPPQIPHDGHTVRPAGFRKRVLYLDTGTLDDRFAGAAADQPNLPDKALRDRIHRLHLALSWHDDLEAQSRFALIVERLEQHLRRDVAPPRQQRDTPAANRLRELLDARLPDGVSLADAADLLGVHRVHLVRSFTREFGIPPHQYVTGRRVELARRGLLAGEHPAEVATAAGFYDQSHLNRHFKRMLGVSPGRYAIGA